MIRKWLLGMVGLGAIGVGLAAGGCGGDGFGGAGGGSGGSGSTATAGVVTAEEGCAAYAKAVCGRYSQCSPFIIQAYYGDQAGCEKRAALSCPSLLTLPGILATAADFKTCADAYQKLDCEQVFDSKIPSECGPIRAGARNDADPCAASAQCKSGRCGMLDDAGCGVCVHVPGDGETCDALGSDCAAGHYCETASSICQTINGTEGAMCAEDAACGVTLKCISGKCQKPLALGADCQPGGAACDTVAGLFCNKVSMKCDALKIGVPGSSCGQDTTTGKVKTCGGDGICQNDPMSNLGTCAAATADGAACMPDPMSGADPCARPARCLGGVCKTDVPSTCK